MDAHESSPQAEPASSAEFRARIQINSGAITLRFVVVAVLAVALMIPLLLVGVVVDDRNRHYHEAIANIAQSWGGSQRIAGPMLLIPIEAGDDEDDEPRYVAVMPERVDIRMASRFEMRRRGIYQTPVFDLDVLAEGTFAPLDSQRLHTRFGRLRSDQAMMVVAVTDVSGIRDATLRWKDDELDLNAVSHPTALSGLRSLLAGVAMQGGSFSLTLALRGTERFSAVPVGDRSTVKMTSTWPHPSFDGRFLPDEHDLGDDGFTASWTTFDLARGFPRVLRIVPSQGDVFADKDVGFSVFEPVNLYSSVERSVKYGVLFVVLTLASVLCLELFTGRRFHFIQYGVAGIALVLFFLTLLALAEHIGFTLGYLVAAVVLTGMISWYVHGASGTPRLAAIAAGALAALYAVLYMLLRLESLALLVGTGVLLATLAMLMRATRQLTPPASASGAGRHGA